MTAQAGDTYTRKQALRRELRARRLLVSGPCSRRASRQAARHALALLRALRARRVCVYLDYGSELPTGALIAALRRAGVHVAVPRILGPGTMRFEWLRHDAALRRNRYGIAEPARHGARVRRAELDAIILPLLGFDARGARLGTGGGYYDRWLARPRIGRRPCYLGYAYAIQQVDRLPRDPWDVPLDAVITEQGVKWPIG